MSGLAQCWGAVPDGVSAVAVRVEAHVARGLPSMGVIGLPGATIGEARSRVRSAVASSALRWPEGRITIALAPADVPKHGTGLDLAIAIALLAADGQLPVPDERTGFIGELGLDGTVRPVRSVLAMAVALADAGRARALVAAAGARTAAIVPGLEIVPVHTLAEALGILRGTRTAHRPGELSCELPCEPPSACAGASETATADLRDVRGQAMARLAVEVVAAGGHHALLAGEPGSGKTMIAERVPSVLPPMSAREAADVTMIHAAAGDARADAGLLRTRPFIAPHHSASAAAMLGSLRGREVRPGAVTLAHLGVLFMDEAPEFARPCIEGLREPLESGGIALARAGGAVRLPARFRLLAAANPCPCGQGPRSAACACSAMARRRYRERLSGPFLDRIDVRIDVERPTRAELRAGDGEESAAVLARVLAARERMHHRIGERENAALSPAELRGALAPERAASAVLDRLEGEGPRGLDRIVRVAWTLADLRGGARPSADDVAMAVTLRASA